MLLTNKTVGFCFTGSFCMFKNTIEEMKNIIKEDGNILPIMSFNAYNLDTKFGLAQDFIKTIEEIAKKDIIHTIAGAEPIGPKRMTDIMIIAPCTGNTLGKLANGITDTPVLMAAKSHLRNNNPLIIAVSTNDGFVRLSQEQKKQG